ncbi:hypothetical protein MHBO_003622 [Bonamia ostreae]|uniref:RRM domain-containing protein n=1 Tax=Bonamia ostreae TaxID=126728 RepID=A0ABV2AR47_9EUKA
MVESEPQSQECYKSSDTPPLSDAALLEDNIKTAPKKIISKKLKKNGLSLKTKKLFDAANENKKAPFDIQKKSSKEMRAEKYINWLKNEGYDVFSKKTKSSYAEIIPPTQNSHKQVSENTFKNNYTKKRKFLSQHNLNKKFDSKNYFSLLIKNADNKRMFLNNFKLKSFVCETFKDAVECDLLPFGDIRIFFNNIEDKVKALKSTDIKKFGDKAILTENSHSMYKIVIHHIPRYISEEDITRYFREIDVKIRSLTFKKLKNNEHFSTGFINLEEKSSYDMLIKAKKFTVARREFKISRYIDKKKLFNVIDVKNLAIQLKFV